MEHKAYPNIGEDLYSATLPNGLRLCVVPKPGFRSAFAVLAVRCGGAYRRFSLDGERYQVPAGVAHYLEHKMFDLPDGDDALERLTSNGADHNAFTADDITCYHFECAGNFYEDLRLLLHLVCTPYFTEETVQKEQGIIAQEILEDRDDPVSVLYDRMLRQLYAGHPIRDRILGTVESIRQISAQTLELCYRAFYTPRNMVLCVAGDLDPAEVERIAREELPETGDDPAAVDFGPEEGMDPAEPFHREEMDVSAPQFLIGVKIAPSPTGEARLRQRLTASLALRLLLGSSSPFYQRLYAQGLLDRDFGAELDFSAGTGSLLLGGESRDPEAVLRELRKELEQISREGFDPGRFERAKRASLGARLRGLEDFESLCLALAEDLFVGYCPLDAAALLPQIQKEDCEAFLRDALLPERLALSIIAPRRT